MKVFKPLLLVFLMVNLDVFAQADNRFLWLVHESQDVIGSGHSAPSNIAADTNRLLVALLADYHIEFQVAPLSRIDRFLKTQSNTCATNRVKTAFRTDDNLFSLPLNLYLGVQLYSVGLNNRVPPVLLNEQLQLTALAHLFSTFPERVLGIGKSRSYGEQLDRQISLLNRENLFVRAGKNPSESMLAMSKRNRIDYLIEFPVVVRKAIRKVAGKVKLTSVEIADSDRYILGYIACTKTPQSQRFIEAVNTVLRKLYQSDAFYHAHSRYLDDIDMPIFNRYYQQVFVHEGEN